MKFWSVVLLSFEDDEVRMLSSVDAAVLDFLGVVREIISPIERRFFAIVAF